MDFPWAVPGQKVQFMNVEPLTYWPKNERPEPLRIYTIRNVWNDGGSLVADFETLYRSFSSKYFGFQVGYSLSRLRPLITKTEEQDIALFTHYLNTERVGA